MLSHPKPGDRVQIWYAPKPRGGMPYHAALATVVLAGDGRPRNHLVRTDHGDLVVVPAGNLRTPQEPTP